MYLEKNTHNTVVGITRFGKSYFVKKQLVETKCGAIYFNTRRETENLENFFEIDANVDFDVLVDKLKKGYSFNFIASQEFDYAEKELKALINLLIDNNKITQKKPIFLAVDEIQLFTSVGKRALKKMATIGLGSGINGIFISQRLKNIDNDIMTQASTNIFFNTRFEENYYKSYGLDAEKISNSINNKKYKFVKVTPEKFEIIEKI